MLPKQNYNYPGKEKGKAFFLGKVYWADTICMGKFSERR
jgi:hypothetical protein